MLICYILLFDYPDLIISSSTHNHTWPSEALDSSSVPVEVCNEELWAKRGFVFANIICLLQNDTTGRMCMRHMVSTLDYTGNFIKDFNETFFKEMLIMGLGRDDSILVMSWIQEGLCALIFQGSKPLCLDPWKIRGSLPSHYSVVSSGSRNFFLG